MTKLILLIRTCEEHIEMTKTLNDKMNNQNSHFDRIQQATQTRELMSPNTELYNSGSWMKYGDSPTAIIFMMTFFVSMILSKSR